MGHAVAPWASRRPGPAVASGRRARVLTREGPVFPPLRLKEALGLGGLGLREVAQRTWREVNDNEIFTRAAAVAFYAMLAMVPFLAVTLTIVVQRLPDVSVRSRVDHLRGEALTQLESTVRSLVPKEANELVMDQIERIQKQPPVGLLSVGLIVSLWLASSLFLAIIDAMNRVYGVRETRSLIRLRVVALVMTLIQAAILLVALLVIVAWPPILAALHLDPNGSAAWMVSGVRWAVVFLMLMISFALSFYVAPDARQRWEWITPGALFGTVLFLVFCVLFRVYVQNFANYNKTYGSLGGVMVILFWFWSVSVLLLTAGALNKVIEDASPLGKSHGQKGSGKVDPSIRPDFEAMPPTPAAP